MLQLNCTLEFDFNYKSVICRLVKIYGIGPWLFLAIHRHWLGITLVIYKSRVVIWGIFKSRVVIWGIFKSRVVIYDRRGFIRLATDFNFDKSLFETSSLVQFDQIVILFFQYLAIHYNENLPNSYFFGQI